jgi:hypothetical protein
VVAPNHTLVLTPAESTAMPLMPLVASMWPCVTILQFLQWWTPLPATMTLASGQWYTYGSQFSNKVLNIFQPLSSPHVLACSPWLHRLNCARVTFLCERTSICMAVNTVLLCPLISLIPEYSDAVI